MAPLPRVMVMLAMLAGCAREGADPEAAMRASAEQNRASLSAVQAMPAPIIPSASRAGVALPARGVVVSLPGPEGAPAAAGARGGTGIETAAALIGAEPERVIRALGVPRLRRRDGPTEVWLFAGPQCHLDLVFYPEAAGLRVGFAEARADGAAQRTEAECLAGIARPS